jgi:hypothetical protein
MGDYEGIVSDLYVVAKINRAMGEFFNWRSEMFKKRHLAYNNYIKGENTAENEGGIANGGEIRGSQRKETTGYLNLFKKINLVSIWQFKSQVKLIIVCCFCLFVIQNNVYYNQLLIRKTKQEIFNVSYFFAFLLICGNGLGFVTKNTTYFKRKGSLYLFSAILCVCFMLAGVIAFQTEVSWTMFEFSNIFIAANFQVFQTYVNEIFPSLTKVTALSIIRLSARLINIIFIFILLDKVVPSMFIMSILNGVLIFILFLFKLPETKDIEMKEFPDEMKDPRFDSSKENVDEEEEGDDIGVVKEINMSQIKEEVNEEYKYIEDDDEEINEEIGINLAEDQIINKKNN